MKISILGCGWLGLPLALSLIENGHFVNGSTRDPDKLGRIKDYGIEPYLLELSPDLISDNVESFFDSEILVINIPPERRDDIVEFHSKQMENIIAVLNNSCRIL